MAKMKQLTFDLDNLKDGLYESNGQIYYSSDSSQWQDYSPTCVNCDCNHEFKEIVLLTSSVFECIHCGKEKKS